MIIMNLKRVQRSVLPFVFGILLGYFYRIYLDKQSKRQKSQVNSALENEINKIHTTLLTVQRQLDEISMVLNRKPDNYIEDKVDFERYELRSEEEAFFDTSENAESVQNNTSASPDSLFTEFDRMFDDNLLNKRIIYDNLRKHYSSLSSEANYLWRLTKATFLLSKTAHFQDNANKTLKKDLLYEAFGYAKKALELDNKNAECHKWYAITVGSLSDYVSAKEKIANGTQFKSHLDIAMSLKQDDPTLYHLAGRFCVELMSLTWIERKIANTFVGTLPPVSYEVALKYFNKAYDLKPEWKENIFYLTKTLIALNNKSKAITYINQGLNIPPSDQEETIIHEQLKKLAKI